MNEVERYVAIYGEEWRQTIESSLKFLNEHEPNWNLEVPMDRDKFVKRVITQDHDDE